MDIHAFMTWTLLTLITPTTTSTLFQPSTTGRSQTHRHINSPTTITASKLTICQFYTLTTTSVGQEWASTTGKVHSPPLYSICVRSLEVSTLWLIFYTIRSSRHWEQKLDINNSVNDHLYICISSLNYLQNHYIMLAIPENTLNKV